MHANGCGNCEKRCQVERQGIKQSKKTSVDLKPLHRMRFMYSSCPQKAMSLKKRANEVRPPQTRDDLYDIIMSHKKGRFGKLKNKGKNSDRTRSEQGKPFAQIVFLGI